MAEDIAAKQAAMAAQTMAKAQEQHQNHAYQQAVLIAVRETGLAETHFPKNNPFSLNECLDYKYFPK